MTYAWLEVTSSMTYISRTYTWLLKVTCVMTSKICFSSLTSGGQIYSWVSINIWEIYSKNLTFTRLLPCIHLNFYFYRVWPQTQMHSTLVINIYANVLRKIQSWGANACIEEAPLGLGRITHTQSSLLSFMWAVPLTRCIGIQYSQN